MNRGIDGSTEGGRDPKLEAGESLRERESERERHKTYWWERAWPFLRCRGKEQACSHHDGASSLPPEFAPSLVRVFSFLSRAANVSLSEVRLTMGNKMHAEAHLRLTSAR
jgi:hypothetical protein